MKQTVFAFLTCRGLLPWRFPSAVQTQAGALIQVHVGITKKAFGHTLHVSRYLSQKLCRRHVQVSADFRAGVNFWDVEAIAFSLTQHIDKPKKYLQEQLIRFLRKKKGCSPCLSAILSKKIQSWLFGPYLIKET